MSNDIGADYSSHSSLRSLIQYIYFTTFRLAQIETYVIRKTPVLAVRFYLSASNRLTSCSYPYFMKNSIRATSTNPEAPLVLIDGQPSTWRETGYLLQAFEGSQVKVVIKDVADEFEWYLIN